MANLVYSERIGKTGHVTVGCSATILDASGHKVLLTRRAGSSCWSLPSGCMDLGESIVEACLREVLEETGLHGTITRLSGIYSDPHCLLEYADGECCQIVALNFVVDAIAGQLRPRDETTEYGYFSLAELEQMDVMEHHLERIRDAFDSGEGPIVN
ncbi:MAG TPA: NUDIX domain-containing protein [Trichocoleus sp.]